MLRIYWNLAHLIFQIYQSWFWSQKRSLVRLKLVPTLKVPRICWNLGHLIFQVCRSLFLWWYFYQNLTCLLKCVDLLLWTVGWFKLLPFVALLQRQLLHFFYSQLELSLSPQSFLCHYECHSSKLLNSCLAIV